MALIGGDGGRARERAGQAGLGFSRAARCVLALLVPLALVAACSQSEPQAPPSGEIVAPSMEERQGGAKYSPLDQINADNVDQLEIAWEYHTGEIDTSVGALAAFEDEPLIAENNLIICTITRRIIALDPATGEERWVYDPAGEIAGMRKCRGVSAWTDARAEAGAQCRTRLLFATADNRLIAIDARSGEPCAGFGEDGVVQMRASKPEVMAGEVTATSRPAIVNGVVVVGSTVADNQRSAAPSGRVLAYDARTGASRWEFDPLPRGRAHAASADWEGGTAGETGAANVWSTMSVDEALDIVYLPTTSPSPDFFGGERPGDNRFADSIVAVRGATGEVVWSFQFTHHNIWDYDTPTGPLLIDYPNAEGAMVPALVQLTKTGMVFIFDRATGAPLVPIEERAVPTDGTVPGEAALSPTQPFPVGMPALVPQGFEVDDAWGFTPFDRASCRERVEELRHGPLYTPPSEQGTILNPGSAGGANWGGGAYDPESHILVVPTARVAMVVTLIPRDSADAQVDQASIESSGAMTFPNAGAPYLTRAEPLMSSFGAPCSEPPWAALTGIDIVRREIVWEVPLGTIDRLAPIPIPVPLGTPGAGGPLVTAGGIAFIGYTLDHRFRAFDLRTGEVLWKSPSLQAPANSTPITYSVGGEQYVVITAGGHSMYGTERGDSVVAYRLRRR